MAGLFHINMNIQRWLMVVNLHKLVYTHLLVTNTNITLILFIITHNDRWYSRLLSPILYMQMVSDKATLHGHLTIYSILLLPSLCILLCFMSKQIESHMTPTLPYLPTCEISCSSNKRYV